MNVSEGEPEVKRTRHKLLIAPPDDLTLCGLSLSLWYELILKRYVTLVALVALKRTCRLFATFKRLRQWIKLKELTAFGTVERKHWNHFAPYDGAAFYYLEKPDSRNKLLCIMWVDQKTWLYIASDKKTLWNAFSNSSYVTGRNHAYSVESRYRGLEIRYEWTGWSCYIQGMDKEVRAWHEAIKKRNA